VVYPIWALLFFVNGLFIIGYYYQNKALEQNERKRVVQDKLDALT